MDGRFDALDIEDNWLVDQRSSVTGTFSPINFASLVYPVSTRYGMAVLGAAYRDVYDWKRSYEYTRNYEDTSGYYAEIVDGFERTGGIKAFSLAAAFSPSPVLMLGASASFLRGETHAEDRFVVTGNTAGNRNDVSRSSTLGYDGTAIELGALVLPIDALRIGARVSLPYSRTSTNRYEDGSEVVSTLHVPTTVTLGLAVVFDENNRLAFDYKHEPWSQASFTRANGETIENLRHDLTSYHVGFEHLMERSSSLQALRMGAFTRPTAWSDAHGDVVSGFGGALGTGWATSHFSIDFSAMYIHMQPHARWPNNDPAKRFDVQDNELLFTVGMILYM